MVPMEKLHPNNGQLAKRGIPKNSRFIKDAKYRKLKQSIIDDPEMLQLRELIAYDSGDAKMGYVICGGNMRYRAMKDLGYTEAPVKLLPPTFPADKLRRIILKDNSAFGETDFDALLSEWDLADIEAAAIDIPDIPDPHTDEADDARDDDFDISGHTPKTAKSKEGDLYRLGDHLLICGDSTKPETLEALFADGTQADLLITDPPYNVDYASKNKALNAIAPANRIQRPFENDKMSNEVYAKFAEDFVRMALGNLKAGGAAYIWIASRTRSTVERAVEKAGEEVRQVLIWNKNNFVLGRQDYQWKHEPCLYFWKSGAAHYFIDKRNLITMIEQAQENIEKQTKEQLRDIVERVFIKQELPMTVIYCEKPLRSADHPMMKPVPLIGRLMTNSSRRGETVLDLFGGSGTTMIAAEQLGRKCRMVEYEPIYVDVIIKRWEELTGQKAVLLGNIHEKEAAADSQKPRTGKPKTKAVAKRAKDKGGK